MLGVLSLSFHFLIMYFSVYLCRLKFAFRVFRVSSLRHPPLPFIPKHFNTEGRMNTVHEKKFTQCEF